MIRLASNEEKQAMINSIKENPSDDAVAFKTDNADAFETNNHESWFPENVYVNPNKGMTTIIHTIPNAQTNSWILISLLLGEFQAAKHKCLKWSLTKIAPASNGKFELQEYC